MVILWWMSWVWEHCRGYMPSVACTCAQVDWPLPYWPGVIVSHAIYAGFELKRFDNFQKYGEVGTIWTSAVLPVASHVSREQVQATAAACPLKAVTMPWRTTPLHV